MLKLNETGLMFGASHAVLSGLTLLVVGMQSTRPLELPFFGDVVFYAMVLIYLALNSWLVLLGPLLPLVFHSLHGASGILLVMATGFVVFYLLGMFVGAVWRLSRNVLFGETYFPDDGPLRALLRKSRDRAAHAASV